MPQSHKCSWCCLNFINGKPGPPCLLSSLRRLQLIYQCALCQRQQCRVRRVAPAMYALSLVSLGLRLQLLFCFLDSNRPGCKTQRPTVETRTEALSLNLGPIKITRCSAPTLPERHSCLIMRVTHSPDTSW